MTFFIPAYLTWSYKYFLSLFVGSYGPIAITSLSAYLSYLRYRFLCKSGEGLYGRLVKSLKYNASTDSFEILSNFFYLDKVDIIPRNDLKLHFVTNKFRSNDYYVLADMTRRFIIPKEENTILDETLLNELLNIEYHDPLLNNVLINRNKMLDLTIHTPNASIDFLARVKILSEKVDIEQLSNKELKEGLNGISQKEISNFIKDYNVRNFTSTSSEENLLEVENSLTGLGISCAKQLAEWLNKNFSVRNLDDLYSLSSYELDIIRREEELNDEDFEKLVSTIEENRK